ncbi:exopolysaccharide Pel transporter PelG [Psychrilyobacter atlanticus]|uniref:exopolysaccharide Pel transporter PelG n=1 Tax=Psychrilyobacter atlanticus TaxID=271091 RepID=UPI00040C4D6D|nr:exopolysaccharide Pel transporter PelG [Psychrilyobacter atlanticus]
MAGIGFELRKLFYDDDSFSGYIKALTFSTFISVGPFIAMVLSINILILVSNLIFNNSSEQLLFITTLVYIFIFSQLISFPFQFFVTRYISDRFYEKEYKKVRPSFIGISKIIIILSLVLGVIFFGMKELPLYYKYLSIGILITLSLLWTITTYISILKDYVYISKIYFYSTILSVLVFFITTKYPIMFSEHRLAGNMLTSFFIGVLFSLHMLTNYFFSIFKEGEGGEYEFLGYLKNYSSLLFTGLFYILGTWSHIIINWFSPWAVNIGYGFRITLHYENAIFYSFLLTIPSIVFFVVFIETRFFDIYQKYYALTLKNGTLDDIEKERKKMRRKLYKEVFYALQIQIFITITALLFSRYFIIYYGVPAELVEIFKIVSLGAIANIYIIILISIFFYFNALKSALKVTGLFCFLNTSFTLIFINFGEKYIGFGFFLGSVISVLYALQLFDKIIDGLNYTTFYSQNFALKHRGRSLSKIIGKMNHGVSLRWKERYLKIGLSVSFFLLIIFSYQILK